MVHQLKLQCPSPEIIHTCEAALDECCDVEGLAAEYASLQAELEVVTGLMQRHISANAHASLDRTYPFLRIVIVPIVLSSPEQLLSPGAEGLTH
jgi:hypothetical protein